jgi:hypothetical protein
MSAVSPEARRSGRAFAAWIEADPDWERVRPVPAGRVGFRLRPRAWPADDPRLDGLNERLAAAVNATGQVGLSRARVAGRRVLLLELGRLRGGADGVERAWAVLRAEALRLRATPPVLA